MGDNGFWYYLVSQKKEIKNVMELLAKTGTLYLNVSMKILFISMVFIKMVMSIIHLILCQEELMNLNYITI